MIASQIWLVSFKGFVLLYLIDLAQMFLNAYLSFTAWKQSVFGVILVVIFLHLDWMRTRKYPNTDTFHKVITDASKNMLGFILLTKALIAYNFLCRHIWEMCWEQYYLHNWFTNWFIEDLHFALARDFLFTRKIAMKKKKKKDVVQDFLNIFSEFLGFEAQFLINIFLIKKGVYAMINFSLVTFRRIFLKETLTGVL